MSKLPVYSNTGLARVPGLIKDRVREHLISGKFCAAGMVAFCGVQGSGKTLSATLYARQLMDIYPHSILVTNLSLNFDYWDVDRCIAYEGFHQIHDMQNGEYGLIYLLDEIQLEFNSLDSKKMSIPIFEAVCQQRKQRKTIIGTTQVFGRLAKPFREQFRNVVLCDNFWGVFFRQRVFSAENVATDDDVLTQLKPAFTRWYIPSRADFASYDTLEIISRVGRDNF